MVILVLLFPLDGESYGRKRGANIPLSLESDILLGPSTWCLKVVVGLSVRKTQFEAKTYSRCAIAIF